ncbi:MAG: hypothetical protein IPJ03_17580 [Ignavibacteriales bacterium]|nr:hypothetical protein [Ignavibacteriales bacterium]
MRLPQHRYRYKESHSSLHWFDKRIYYFRADAPVAVTDRIFITNIQGDAKIHKQSFQYTVESGYSTTVARSINVQMNAYDLLSSICYESFGLLSTT